LRRLAAVIFTALTLLSTAAFAQEFSDTTCPKKPPADKRAQRWAGRWFVMGEQAAKQARFQEALESFLCSLHLSPHQNTVFNVAQLTNLVEDKATATTSIKKFREEHPESEFDDELSDLMVSLQKSQGITPVEEPAAGPPPPAVEQPEPSSGEAEGATPKGKALLGAGYSAITVAGATLVIGFVLQGMAGAAKKDAEDASTIDGFQESEDNRKGRQAGAVAMYVMTGVLVGAGILMVVLGRPEDEAGGDGGAHVEITAGPGGAAINGRF